MPLRPLLLLIAGLCLACGFLKARKEEAPAPSSLGAPAPAAPPSDAAEAPRGGVLQPSVSTQAPNVAPGTALSPVEADYEYLFATGTIDACPEGTALNEKKREDADSRYCALPGDVRHGPWINTWPNGAVREIGPYVGGYREGVFTTWDRAGRLTSRYTWKNNQPVEGHVF